MKQTPAAADEQDRALVKEYLDGEGRQDAAAEGLVDRYQKRLFNLALRMTGNAQDAEDVTQTVFLNAFLKLRTYDPRYRFFSWIYRMTVNESLNELKRRKRTVPLDDEPAIPSPDAALDVATEAQDQLSRALKCLKPDDRSLVVLKHFLFLSYEEMADVFEIDVRTLKSRLFTARERLGTALRSGDA